MKVSSGAEIFDNFLDGGYENDVITVIYGPSGSGKTTLCKLAAIAQAKEKKKSIYIDTEGGFSLERMKQLAGSETEEILKYIILLKPTSFEEQKNSLQKLKSIKNIGLVIIDTMTFFYRLEVAKSRNIKQINNDLIHQVSYLTEIARKHNIPIILTNQVYSDFQKKDDFKMVGGNILRYNSKCLLKLDNLKKNYRQVELISHRSIPEGKCMEFALINEGVV